MESGDLFGIHEGGGLISILHIDWVPEGSVTTDICEELRCFEGRCLDLRYLVKRDLVGVLKFLRNTQDDLEISVSDPVPEEILGEALSVDKRSELRKGSFYASRFGVLPGGLRMRLFGLFKLEEERRDDE